MNKNTISIVIILFGIAFIIAGVFVFSQMANADPPPMPNFTSNITGNCELNAMGEYLTAYSDFRENCTKNTNLDNYTFFHYKP